MKQAYAIVLAIGLSFLLTACYPDKIDFASELDLVATSYDQEFDFASKQTYYLVDSLALNTNVENADIDPEELERVEGIIFSEVEAQMSMAGYTRLNDDEAENGVDLVLTASAFIVENNGSAWIPGGGWWWWGYPPGWGWGPGWGWYYPPGWGGYPVYFSYTTGTLILFVSDYNGAENGDGEIGENVPLVWQGAADGYLNNQVSDARLRGFIDQMWEQSPYFRSAN